MQDYLANHYQIWEYKRISGKGYRGGAWRTITMNCPMCKNDAGSDSIHIPANKNEILYGIAHGINPDWHMSDGMCESCFDILGTPALPVESTETSDDISRYRKFMRYHLSRMEHKQWHCPVRELQRYQQNQIMSHVSEIAIDDGYEGWLIYDADEVLASHYVGTMKAA
jgi:hypothetical protein